MLQSRTILSAVLAAASVVAPVALAAQVYQPTTCRNAFTPEQEMQAGNKVVAQVYQQMPVLPDSDPVSRYIEGLGQRLAAAAPATPGLNFRWPFRFHVVASEDINAFALPGGTMFVNLGAIRAAETEAQLAGVMSHEMSHVILRHSTCNLTQQQKKSLWYGIGAIGSSILLGNSGLGSLARGAIGLGENLDFLHMSRADEQQADLLGVQIAHNAGYDPRGLPQFFEIIQAKYGSGGAQFLSDHPNPGNRTAYVNAEIAQLSPLPNPIKTTPAFVEARRIAAGQRVYSSKEMEAGQWRGTGLYAGRPGGAAEAGSSGRGGALPASSGAGPVSGIAPIPLGRLGLRDPFATMQMERYSVRAPQSWQKSDQQGDSVTLAPAGGAGRFGVAYGVVIGLVTIQNGGVEDENTLAQATSNLAQKLEQSGGLNVSGNMQRLRVGNMIADAVPMRGTSPVSDNGQPLAERDWLVTVARPDGDVNYFIFVSPERDFGALQPTFNSIVNSLQVW